MPGGNGGAAVHRWRSTERRRVRWPRDAVSTGDGLTRSVGFFGLLLTSEGSIIGSGWLFGALACATIGGPAAIIAWIIGSFAVILLALVHAELGGMFPVSGGTTRFPYYAFGGLAGASFGWFSWLQAVGTAPIEVEAAITYTSNYWHGLTHTVGGTVVLTGTGYLVATAMMALFVVANLFGIRYLVRANNAITVWKVLIPTLTIVVLFFTAFRHLQLHPRRWLRPLRPARRPQRGERRWGGVRPGRIRAGGAAGWREQEPPTGHAPSGDLLHAHRGHHLPVVAGGVHRGAAPPGPGPRVEQHLLLPASSDPSPGWPRGSAWHGWPTSSMPTPSSPRPGRDSSTPPPPAASPSG